MTAMNALLTAIVIWADGLDGYFARKLKQATKFGAMLDIAGDRVDGGLFDLSFFHLSNQV